MAILRIYTDGACAGNQSDQNIGGWGAILEYGEHQKELFGGQANTTNNRMELTAVIEAFKALKQANQKIEVFTDSSYVANCFREEWYVSWQRCQKVGGESGALERTAGAGAAARGAVFPRQGSCQPRE